MIGSLSRDCLFIPIPQPWKVILCKRIRMALRNMKMLNCWSVFSRHRYIDIASPPYHIKRQRIVWDTDEGRSIPLAVFSSNVISSCGIYIGSVAAWEQVKRKHLTSCIERASAAPFFSQQYVWLWKCTGVRQQRKTDNMTNATAVDLLFFLYLKLTLHFHCRTAKQRGSTQLHLSLRAPSHYIGLFPCGWPFQLTSMEVRDHWTAILSSKTCTSEQLHVWG